MSGTGEVRCGPGLRNTRRLLTAFGRPEIPVSCGREIPGPAGRWFPSAWRDGADAFFGVPLPAVDGESARGDEAAAAMLARIASEAKAAGDPITLVPLGPWTNLADAAALDPSFAGNIAGIHAMGGTIDAPGNIEDGETTPADMNEWNFAVDPDALAAVLALDVPVTMVGLDATEDVPVPADIESILGRGRRGGRRGHRPRDLPAQPVPRRRHLVLGHARRRPARGPVDRDLGGRAGPRRDGGPERGTHGT